MGGLVARGWIIFEVSSNWFQENFFRNMWRVRRDLLERDPNSVFVGEPLWSPDYSFFHR